MTSSSSDYEKEAHGDEFSQDAKAQDIEKAGEHGAHDRESAGASTEYPHGKRLAIIVVSLMLSTFLVALDNVGTCTSPTATGADCPAADYSRYGNSKDHRPIPRPRQSCVVRLSILHDFWRLSIHLGQVLHLL